MKVNRAKGEAESWSQEFRLDAGERRGILWVEKSREVSAHKTENL